VVDDLAEIAELANTDVRSYFHETERGPNAQKRFRRHSGYAHDSNNKPDLMLKNCY